MHVRRWRHPEQWQCTSTPRTARRPFMDAKQAVMLASLTWRSVSSSVHYLERLYWAVRRQDKPKYMLINLLICPILSILQWDKSQPKVYGCPILGGLCPPDARIYVELTRVVVDHCTVKLYTKKTYYINDRIISRPTKYCKISLSLYCIRIRISRLNRIRMSAGSLLWIRSLSTSLISPSFTKKRLVTWEVLINLLICRILQCWGKWKSYLESVSWTGSPPKVKRFFPLTDALITPSFKRLITCSNPADRPMYRPTNKQRRLAYITSSTSLTAVKTYSLYRMDCSKLTSLSSKIAAAAVTCKWYYRTVMTRVY